MTCPNCKESPIDCQCSDEPRKPVASFGSWISVKERLPTADMYVLIATTYLDSPILMASRNIFEGWRNSDGYLASTEAVTHWMPLPEAPKNYDPPHKL